MEAIRVDQGYKPNLTIKRLRILLKTFSAYSTTAEQLPPETLIPVSLFTLPKLFKKILGLQEG